jgi:hypothetical protein
MKKYGIISKSNESILHTYYSNFPISFGGSWGDESKVEVLEVAPNALDEEKSNLKVGEYNKLISETLQPTNETKLAFDSSGRAILGQNGVQVSLPTYELVGQYQRIRALIKKD